MKLFPPEDKRVDRACQWWKYILDVAGVHAQKLIPNLCVTLCEAFAQSQQSVFLYVAAVIVRTFPPGRYNEDDGSLCFSSTEIAVKFRDYFIPNVIQHIQLNSSFPESNPDLCEDLFGFLIMYVDNCPELIINSSLLPDIMSTIVVCLNTTHRHLFRIVIDVAVELYKYMLGNWDQKLNSTIYPLLYLHNTSILNVLFQSSTGHRRTDDSLSSIHLLPHIISFHLLMNGPNAPVPSSYPGFNGVDMQKLGKNVNITDLLMISMNNANMSRAAPHVKKDLIVNLLEFERHQSDRLMDACRRSLQTVLREAKGERDN
jgi:hypothetical protein